MLRTTWPARSLQFAPSPKTFQRYTLRGRTTIAAAGAAIQERRGAAVYQRPVDDNAYKGELLGETLTKTYVPVPPGAERPGALDDSKFIQDWSVSFWRNFRIPDDIKNNDLPLSTRAQAIGRSLQEAARKARVFDSPQSVAYWSYHLSRMSFFATQGLAGLAFSNFVKQQSEGVSSSASAAPSGMDLGRLLRSGLYVPFSEALLMFYQDYENVRRGVYKLPWDMTTSGHKQTNPLNVLDKFTRFMREASSTLARRDRGTPDKVWLESGLYPDYYLNSWHYQTDGWLSEESAKVYEASTETVFVGRQDAMQRQSLVPLRAFMQRKRSVDGSGMKLLEVACGTGRFATFVKDNYPRLGVTQLDLSPFYLAEARANLDYWRSKRGGPRPEDTVASQDRFLHAPAEKIPTPDATFDVVSTVYLFHELPEQARKDAAAEMARVLRPGGLLVFNDGTQLGDRPINDKTQGNFEAFNEPNWGTHIALDYGKLFSDAGLIPDMKVLASGSKVLSFTKPLPKS